MRIIKMKILLANLMEYDKFKNLGRNDKCGCGSGKKFKKCCINFDWKNEIKNHDCKFTKNVKLLAKKGDDYEKNK
jgi:hypothetical protein